MCLGALPLVLFILHRQGVSRTSVLTLPLLAARRRGAQARAWPQLRSRDCSTARAVLRLWGATAVEPRDTLSTPAAATRSGGGDEGEGEGEGALGSARAAERQCGRAFYRDRRAATAGELARVWRGRGVPRGGRQRQSACRGARSPAYGSDRRRSPPPLHAGRCAARGPPAIASHVLVSRRQWVTLTPHGCGARSHTGVHSRYHFSHLLVGLTAYSVK